LTFSWVISFKDLPDLNGKWYYYYISVSYDELTSYVEFYNPYEPSILSQFLQLSGPVYPFDEKIEIYFGTWDGSINCGLCGSLQRALIVQDYITAQNDFLLKYGSSSTITDY